MEMSLNPKKSLISLKEKLKVELHGDMVLFICWIDKNPKVW